MTTEIVYELQEVEGGLGVVQGLQVTGISAGFRRKARRI